MIPPVGCLFVSNYHYLMVQDLRTGAKFEQIALKRRFAQDSLAASFGPTAKSLSMYCNVLHGSSLTCE